MKYTALLPLVLLAGLFAQTPRQKSPEDLTLPNGKKWNDAIVEADHIDNIRDSRALAELAAEIRDDFEKSDKFVLPLKTLRKVEDAEKLLKNLRGRLRRN
jgi:hypothetical protein